MRILRVILPVGDIDAAAGFYERLLATVGVRVSPGRHYFRLGQAVVACYDSVADGDEPSGAPNREPIYLAVADIDSVFDRARQLGAQFQDTELPGVGPLSRIARRPWGERSFYCRDPFGNAICFVADGTEFLGEGPTDRPLD